RFSRDWSSEVCSSDLGWMPHLCPRLHAEGDRQPRVAVIERQGAMPCVGREQRQEARSRLDDPARRQVQAQLLERLSELDPAGPGLLVGREYAVGQSDVKGRTGPSLRMDVAGMAA